MGFGATITTGDANAPLRPELAQWLVEARVEQELSKPTRFAVRFEDDICGDQPAVAGAPELRPNTVIAIIAPAGNQRYCLVRGRITQVKCSTRFGGQGSWLEIHGEDRRVEMDRVCVQAAWTGRASDAASQILAAYGFTPEVEQTTTVYAEDGNTLSQRDTDLGFLEKIASENSMELWVAYEVSGGDTPLSTAVSVAETAKLQTSPSPGANPGPPLPPVLVPSGTPTIRVNVSGDDCPNVTSFNAEVDSERPNAARGATVNARDGQVDDAGGESVQPPIDDGAGLVQIDGVERTICVASPGDSEEQRRRQQAALTEASWFVEATASTTAHMLNGVLAPHEVVAVTGAGAQLSGAYQVKEVTHVVNASDHFMDVKLRSNRVGEV
ncbi:MAG: hypothetical protein ACFB13_00030 [Kiloniellaceae bacterium]